MSHAVNVTNRASPFWKIQVGVCLQLSHSNGDGLRNLSSVTHTPSKVKFLFRFKWNELHWRIRLLKLDFYSRGSKWTFICNQWISTDSHPFNYSPALWLLKFKDQLPHVINVTNRASPLGEVKVVMLLMLSHSIVDRLQHLPAVTPRATPCGDM